MADPAAPVAPAPVAPAAAPAPVVPAAPAPVAPAPVAGAPGTPPAAVPPAEPPKTLLSEPPKPDAPIQYDLKLPKDSKLTPADQEAVLAFAKENKMPADMAQKFLERESANRDAFHVANSPGGALWSARVDAMEKQALMHPELGAGDMVKLKAIGEQGRRVLAKYFPPTVSKFLLESGLGSNPDLLLGLANIAKASKEDTIVSPQPAAGAPQNVGDLVNMYKPVKERV